MSALISFNRRLWTPPERLTLSEWSRKHYYLSAESSAEQGRFRPYRYQVGIMDAITDPSVEMVTVKKSARVGFTKILNSVVGYYMHQDPCPILIVQPTVEDAEGYSKEEIAPMLRDCPSLARIFGGERAKTTQDTILHKIYPGGSISMVGANSARGFRRVSRKIILLDERDAYPKSAGSEGDPSKLAIRRSEYYHDRKIVSGSTPVTEGKSAISEAFDEGDQRFFFVPCPHCGRFDKFVFSEAEEGGHWLSWPKGSPEKAHFVCGHGCGAAIEETFKHEITEAGEWQAQAPFDRHASFHVWAAYSSSPNAGWGQLAKEFEECNRAGPTKLKTFVNTVLGETWKEKGEAPDYEKLYARREQYPIESVPSGVRFLTAGVDVQKDRLYFEVVGWGRRKESWSIEAGFLIGDTSRDEVWKDLDALLAKTYLGADGGERGISMLAIDSGYNTQTVYNWARRYPLSRVIAVKGQKNSKALLGSPSSVDVNFRGKRVGYKVWIVGVDVAKAELYGWLRATKDGEDTPVGFCHFPEHGEEYFQQLTAEHLVEKTNSRGFVEFVWEQLPNRENHWLDCRVYARAAASLVGIDRARDEAPQREAKPKKIEATSESEPRAEKAPRAGKKKSSGGGFLSRRRGWL